MTTPDQIAMGQNEGFHVVTDPGQRFLVKSWVDEKDCEHLQVRDVLRELERSAQEPTGEELQELGTTTPVRIASRPTWTDAMFLNTANQDVVLKWLIDKGAVATSVVGGLQVVTAGGKVVEVPYYYWVLLDSQGHPYPCHPAIFDSRWCKA